MPEIFEKEKLIKTAQVERIRTFHEDRVQNMYAYTMHEHMIQNQTLQESKFNFSDSDQMTTVKKHLGTITNKMQVEIPQDEDALNAQYYKLISDYGELIEACHAYLIDHISPHSTKGKTRKNLVQGTLAMAEKERDGLGAALEKLKPHLKEDIVWGNVLGIIRGVSINLNESKMTIGSDGACTSELLVFHPKKEKKYFYKADEKLELPHIPLREKFKDQFTEEKDKQILSKILTLLEGHVSPNGTYFESPIVMAIQNMWDNIPRDPTTINRMIQSKHNINLDMGDWRTREIFMLVYESYSTLRSRIKVSNAARIPTGQSLSVRNVATSRMAAVFGMPNLVVAANKATLHRDGKAAENGNGIIMSEAQGIPHAKLLKMAGGKEKIEYTPEALRQFSCLQLFDTLCGQIDRHWNNRFVTYKKTQGGKYIVTGVQGIDNDMSFGNLNYENIKSEETSKLPRFESPIYEKGVKKGVKCSIKYLDEKMVYTLLHLTEEGLKHYLGDLLEQDYIDAMWNRLQHIKETIISSVENGHSHLVDKGGWIGVSSYNNYTDTGNGYLG